MLLPILLGLGILGVGVAAAAASDKPKAAPPGPAPTPAPTPGGAAAPGTWTPNESQYFDILPNGVRVWKEPYRSQILAYLAQWGVSPAVKDDVTVMQLVPKRSPSDATAAQWLEAFRNTRTVLACRWMFIQHQGRPGQLPFPEYLRAVAPGEELAWAGPQSTAMYAVLTQPPGQQPAPTPPSQPGTPSQPQTPSAPDAFSGLPETLADELRSTMTETTDPAKLVLLADALEAKHANEPAYQKAADALRKRAKELRDAAEIRAIKDGRVYVLRANDLASELAQWFTGNGNRWRELTTTNPKLQIQRAPRGDGTFIEYLIPWVAGQQIILPVGWNAEKGPPPAKLRQEPRAAA